MIDKRTVITGSFNWSPSAAHQNDEVLLVIDSPLLAAHFTREMDRLWKGAELRITERLAPKLQQAGRVMSVGPREGELKLEAERPPARLLLPIPLVSTSKQPRAGDD